MFVLRRLYSRQASFIKHIHPSRKDPGILQQKKILQEAPGDDLEFTDFDEMESDFMNVHKSYKEHVREMDAWKEKEKYLIVKQKYFKEKFPNFLTWHDKEQIRYLYNTNSEEWNLEKLSEGFPALPDVIQKIIKGKWSKKKQNNIYEHDLTVAKNWNDFKQGKLNNLPQELKEHLQKFSKRTFNFQQFEKSNVTEVVVHSKPQFNGEFSEIIASYQRLKEQKLEKQELNKEYEQEKKFINFNKESKFKQKKMDYLLTFKELQNKVEQKMSRGKQVSIQDELLKEANYPINKAIELSQEDVKNIAKHTSEKNNNNQLGLVRKTTKDMSHLVYPQRIIIPENIFKRNYTYKLNDCYYDSDGEFLYRVPGMS